MRFIQRAPKPHRSQADVQASGQPQRIWCASTPTAAAAAATTPPTPISTTTHNTLAFKLLTLKPLRRLAHDVADHGRRQARNIALIPGSLRQHEEGRQSLVGLPGARDGRRFAARPCCAARAV